MGGLKGYLEIVSLSLLPVFYAMFVILLALYLKMAFDVAGLVTVFVAIVPPLGIWAWIMHTRETKSIEAQAKGFKVSPEIQERTLDEYEQMLKKKKQTES